MRSYNWGNSYESQIAFAISSNSKYIKISFQKASRLDGEVMNKENVIKETLWSILTEKDAKGSHIESQHGKEPVCQIEMLENEYLRHM